MRITVIAVGKRKDRAAAELVSEYGKRLPRGVKLAWVEAREARDRSDIKAALAEEAVRIRAQIPRNARVAALSETGKSMDSIAFANWLGGHRDRGHELCFIIGSADGLDPDLIRDAHETISLSPLTFPHELVRPILAEQLYRAFTIINGQPYHRS